MKHLLLSLPLVAILLLQVLGEPDYSKHIRDYSEELQAQEPFSSPYLVYFESNESALYFLAARHQNRESDSTFRLAREVLEKVEPGCVILEGFPSSLGISPGVIVEQLRTYKTVAVIYGAGHLVTQRPALELLMGPPRFQGRTWSEQMR